MVSFHFRVFKTVKFMWQNIEIHDIILRFLVAQTSSKMPPNRWNFSVILNLKTPKTRNRQYNPSHFVPKSSSQIVQNQWNILSFWLRKENGLRGEARKGKQKDGERRRRRRGTRGKGGRGERRRARKGRRAGKGTKDSEKRGGGSNKKGRELQREVNLFIHPPTSRSPAPAANTGICS